MSDQAASESCCDCPPPAPLFPPATPFPPHEQQCANAWLRRAPTSSRRSAAASRVAAHDHQTGDGEAFTYAPAFVPRWPSPRSSSDSAEVSESITVWLPPERIDSVLGGDDRLIETTVNATHSELLAANPVSAHASQDMSNLLYMDQQHVLHNLKQRFDWQLIHSFVGGMLVVCNPYFHLPHIYSPALMQQYNSATLKQLEARQLAPHIYWTTALARKAIVATQLPQAIVISGESGSGKTVNTAHIINFLCSDLSASLPAQSKLLSPRLLHSGSLFESLGNACTVRNNNSSRFARFIRASCDVAGCVTGASITTYLLEKSRVALHAHGERNFHVFYQMLLLARSQPSLANTLQFLSAEHLNPGFWKYLQPPSADKAPSQRSMGGLERSLRSSQSFESDDRCGLDALLKAFLNLDFDDTLQQELWIVVAAVLHLGNVTFEASSGLDVNESCAVDATNPSARAFCHLMGCSIKDLDTALCKRVISIRGAGSGTGRSPAARPGRRPSVQQSLSPQMAAALGNAVGDAEVIKSVRLEDAVRARDVLSKSLYSGMFECVASKANDMLCGSVSLTQSPTWIGVLDIFGFEYFDVNGFEQLCINYANEKLQQLFTSMFIGKEQVVYIRECIEWHELDFKDNRDVIALMEQQHPCLGVFATLDEVCRTVGGSDKGIVAALCSAFVDVKVPSSKLKRSRYATEDNFVIVHYAASVTYSCSGMLEKNRDALLPPIKRVIELCVSDAAVRIKPHISELSASSSDRSKLGGLHSTLSNRFQLQIRALLDVLSGASSTFVRCLKSNNDKTPFCIHDGAMRLQLVSSGLLDSTRITQMGFPFRLPYLSFLQDNLLLIDGYFPNLDTFAKSELKRLCGIVMQNVKISHEHYKLGTNLIFFKAHVAVSIEKAKLTKISDATASLQSSARRLLQRSLWLHRRTLAIKLQCCARSFLSKCCAVSRLIAKLMLQAHLRSFLMKRSCRSLVSAGQYLRGRLIAVARQSSAHKRVISVRVLQMRMISVAAHRSCQNELGRRHVANLKLQAYMRSFFVKRSYNSLMSASRLQAYMRCYFVKRSYKVLVSAIRLQAYIRSFFVKRSYKSLMSASRLQAHTRSFLAKRSHASTVLACRYLSNRLTALEVRSRVQRLASAACILRSRIMSSLANHAYAQEVTDRDTRSAAADTIIVMIQRRLEFRRALCAQKTLCDAVLRAFIQYDVHNLRLFAFSMQSNVRRSLMRRVYVQRVAANNSLLPYITPRVRHLRASYVCVHHSARVIVCAVARALFRTWFLTKVAAVQLLKATITQRFTAHNFFEFRSSACLLQAKVRVTFIRLGARVVAASASRVLCRSLFVAKIHAVQRLKATTVRCLMAPKFYGIRGHACLLQAKIRAAFFRLAARVVAAAAARALCRSVLFARMVAVQLLGATFTRCLIAPKFVEIRHSALILQALVRASSIRQLKMRMAAMMSKKFLVCRFRRWSVQRRYCIRICAALIACSRIARDAARSRYVFRVHSAVALSKCARRCCCQRHYARQRVAAIDMQSMAKMARARKTYCHIIKASVVLAAGLKSSLCRCIFCTSELRLMLATLRPPSAGTHGVVGVECEKKSKMVGWRSRYFVFNFVDMTMSYSQSAAAFQAGQVKGRITFASTSSCHNVAPATLQLQGVHEVLKSAGKDVYTLRFATEQLAQDWSRAFELIAKYSLVVKQKIENSRH